MAAETMVIGKDEAEILFWSSYIQDCQPVNLVLSLMGRKMTKSAKSSHTPHSVLRQSGPF